VTMGVTDGLKPDGQTTWWWTRQYQ